MAVKFTEKQWAKMVETLEKKFSSSTENLSEITDFIAQYKNPRGCRAEKPKTKRVANAYMLWMNDNREKIKDELIESAKTEATSEGITGDALADFLKTSVKVSNVTKKGSSIWNAMSEEEKKPWTDKYNTLKSEAGLSTCSTPGSPWNFEKKTDVVVPEGWSSAHLGKYLQYTYKGADGSTGKGVNRFATFEEAVEAANALGGKCGGITLEQNAYTLRIGNDPITHPKPGTRTYSEASWTKLNFEPEEVEKPKKAKKAKAAKAAKDETNTTENVEDSPSDIVNDNYDNETEDDGSDDDEEETEVERWTFNGKIYLLDPATNDVYDASTCEQIGKKGEGDFAEPKKTVKKMKVSAAAAAASN